MSSGPSNLGSIAPSPTFAAGPTGGSPTIDLPEISVGPKPDLGGALPGDGSYGDPIADFHQINGQFAESQRAFSERMDAQSAQFNNQLQAQGEARSAQLQAQFESNMAGMDAQRAAMSSAPPVTGPILPPNFSETAQVPPPQDRPAAPPAAPGVGADPGIGPIGLAAEAAQTAGEAGVGYRAAMYGEVGAFGRTAQIGPEQQFGRLAANSTLANPQFRGYGIDQFARSNPWPMQTMVSTQATYDYARQQAALNNIPPGDVRFEVRDPGIANRIYDVQTGQQAPYTEIKAGKSIDGRQLGIDIRAAQNGAQIDYRFTGNPLTGNHGPDPAVANRLAAANAATGGNLTSGIADIAPTARQVQAVETAARVSQAARGFGRVAAPVGLAADAYAIGSGIQADGGRFGRNAAVATAGAAGGWGGAAAGAAGGVKFGTLAGTMLGGPVGAAVGAVAGGLIGAVGGGFLGGWGAEEAARAATQ